MDGSAGLAAGVLATIGTVAQAWIQRGAAAGVKELKEQIELQLSGPQGRVTKLEADVKTILGQGPGSLEHSLKEIRAFITTELAAAKATVDAMARQQRRAVGQQPSIPPMDDLRVLLGVDDIERRLKSLEDARDAERRDDSALQAKLERLVLLVELIVDGKIKPKP